MATYTSNYGWTKPSGSDNVDISVLNNNLDDQDSTIHDAFLNMAPPFSELSTYAVDDIVLYTTGLYKCHTAVVTPGSWTGSTNWQVYKLSEGGSGGGGTSNYNDLTNKPSINGVTLSGNKTTSNLGIDKTAVGLSNVPNVSTNDQTPTFTEASTRNNIASGEKLSVILGKVQKFFNDLKTVAFSGSYTDLSNKPQINSVELSGNKTSNDLEIANQSDIAPEFNTTTAYAIGDMVYYQGTLYEFNQAHAVGAWNSAEVQAVDVANHTIYAKNVSYGNENVEDALDAINDSISDNSVFEILRKSDLLDESTKDANITVNNFTLVRIKNLPIGRLLITFTAAAAAGSSGMNLGTLKYRFYEDIRPIKLTVDDNGGVPGASIYLTAPPVAAKAYGCVAGHTYILDTVVLLKVSS